MRRKLSKQLMGMARALSVGQPERRLLPSEQQAYTSSGKPYKTFCAKHHIKCTRAVYQLLKRNLKRTRHGQALAKAAG